MNLVTQTNSLVCQPLSSTMNNRPGRGGINCPECKKVYPVEYVYSDELELMLCVPDYCSGICRAKATKRREEIQAEHYFKTKYHNRVKTILPPKYHDIVYTAADKDKLVSLGQKRPAFITGTSGVGKTVLMAEICKAVLKDPKSNVRWLSYPEYIVTLQSGFRDKNFRADEYIKEAAHFPGTLAIDDLGAEKLTELVLQTTYYILNHREQYNLHTLITSNYSLAQINKAIDPRISSRIAGECAIIELKGKDRRLNTVRS